MAIETVDWLKAAAEDKDTRRDYFIRLLPFGRMVCPEQELQDTSLSGLRMVNTFFQNYGPWRMAFYLWGKMDVHTNHLPPKEATQ